MTRVITLREAVLPQDSPALQALIRDYVAWLDIDLAYRGFEAEMASFDALFTGPSGLFLLACEGEALVGCVGLLRHDAATAEVKRMYVRPSCRGLALGRQLMTALMVLQSEIKKEWAAR